MRAPERTSGPLLHAEVQRSGDFVHGGLYALGVVPMLSLPPTVRVFVVVEPADMHGSFDALAGATRRIGLDPVHGHLYLFLSRRRKPTKVLWCDGSG